MISFFKKIFRVKNLKKAYKTALLYPKLQEAIKKSPEDIQRVKRIIEEIHGDFNEKAIKLAVKVIDNTFARLYDSINLDIPKGVDLLQLSKDNHLILVPNHQSHADYVALTYLLYKKCKLPVHVAGGVNLNIFPLGFMFRNMGCFFLRRRFQGDNLYKLTFEAYISYLLQNGKALEFFFEGGRSRTGKLLPPRFGLFNIILETYSNLNSSKPLMFVPVSVAHEYLPESRAHIRELRGAAKKAESPLQLLKLYKLFTKKFGSIHIRLGEGIVQTDFSDIKNATQDLAFSCFREVGKGMPVTPTSLLALVLLDEPAGVLSWENIVSKADNVIVYCKKFGVPLTESLQSDSYVASLTRALQITIKNKKVKKVVKENLGETFYFITDQSRVELLYFKDMILHHFFVPTMINAAWLNVFNGNITTLNGLAKFLVTRRRELKYEFYLPTVGSMIEKALDVVSECIGRKIESIEECLRFSSEELYAIASYLKGFASSFMHIYEAYYLGGTAIRYLLHEKFSEERFLQVAEEVFEMERTHGRVIKYPESFSVPLMRNCLKYFENKKIIVRDGAKYRVENFTKLDLNIEQFASNLADGVATSFKFSQV